MIPCTRKTVLDMYIPVKNRNKMKCPYSAPIDKEKNCESIQSINHWSHEGLFFLYKQAKRIVPLIYIF